jgi:hypothetical protein
LSATLLCLHKCDIINNNHSTCIFIIFRNRNVQNNGYSLYVVVSRFIYLTNVHLSHSSFDRNAFQISKQLFGLKKLSPKDVALIVHSEGVVEDLYALSEK